MQEHVDNILIKLYNLIKRKPTMPKEETIVKTASKANTAVYVTKFPFCLRDDKIVPPERAEEIENCSNTKVKAQKYYAWKLLEMALLHSFGLRMENLDLRRGKSGKWECAKCYFSLSHSGDFVAVAVSEKLVGVDIEKQDKARFTDALADKILTECEAAAINRLDEEERKTALNVIWTKKETIFKLEGGKAFQPKQIETSKYSTRTKTLSCGTASYIITVASEDADKATYYCDGVEITDL